MLDYLKKNAQKAFREIFTITESPNFLFSNDRKIRFNESRYNYTYLHGFNRLIKNNRITDERLIESFRYIEEKIEQYLKEYYRHKQFVLYINADALIPAFTLTVLSYYGENIEDGISLEELVSWYKQNACFSGLELVEATEEEENENDNEETYPDSLRTYKKIIDT